MPTASISEGENRRNANGQRRGSDGKFLPGNRSGGRPRGSPNKSTLDIRVVKREILASWHRIGGKSRLDEWAKANFGEYIKLIARLLPADIDLAMPADEPTWSGLPNSTPYLEELVARSRPTVVLGPGPSQLLEDLRAASRARSQQDGGNGNGQGHDAS